MVSQRPRFPLIVALWRYEDFEGSALCKELEICDPKDYILFNHFLFKYLNFVIWPGFIDELRRQGFEVMTIFGGSLEEKILKLCPELKKWNFRIFIKVKPVSNAYEEVHDRSVEEAVKDIFYLDLNEVKPVWKFYKRLYETCIEKLRKIARDLHHMAEELEKIL